MSRELKNEFSWSKSRDEVFRRCLRQYYFQCYGFWGGWDRAAAERIREIYILKKLQTREMWAGHRVHRCIEDLLADLRAGRELPMEDAVVEGLLAKMREDFKESRAGRYRQDPKRACGLFEHEYGVQVPDEAWKENAERAVLCVRNFHRSPLLQKIRALPADAWLEIEELAHFDLDGLKVFVQLDFAFREGDRILIYDWKTGRSEADRSDLQMACYVMYATRKWKIPADRVTATAIYLLDGRELSKPIDEAALENARDYIRESADEMLFPLTDPENNIAGDEEAFEFTDNEAHCRRCNFLKICPRWTEQNP